MNELSQNKIVGGVTILLTLMLVAMLTTQCNSDTVLDGIADRFEDVFNGMGKQVMIEAFGNQGMGYWDGAANTNQPVVNGVNGPPVGGTQLTSYQLYQQAVNAATPTVDQLENASNQPGGGYGLVDTHNAPGMVPPAGKNTLYDAAAVDFGNRRAELISPCAQNAPTFVATSLLPKINLPGVPSWDVMDTEALARQDFLAPTQQIGVDTVLSSLRNASRDIRNNIPNPIAVVSPWLNSTILPDLERRNLDSYVPASGVYGCGSSCSQPPLGPGNY